MIDQRQILSGIQSRLTGDAGLTAVVPSTQIGSFLKQDTPYPHIQYFVESENLGIKGEVAHNVTLQLNIYSDYKGFNQVLNIVDLLIAELDGTPITIASGNGFGCSFVTSDTLLEPDGLTTRGTVIFNLLFGE